MRKTLIAALVALPLAAVAAVPETVLLKVANMTCGLCPITVKKALEKVPGVSAVNIDGDKKVAIVTYDPDQAEPEALTSATTRACYPSRLKHQ